MMEFASTFQIMVRRYSKCIVNFPNNAKIVLLKQNRVNGILVLFQEIPQEFIKKLKCQWRVIISERGRFQTIERFEIKIPQSIRPKIVSNKRFVATQFPYTWTKIAIADIIIEISGPGEPADRVLTLLKKK